MDFKQKKTKKKNLPLNKKWARGLELSSASFQLQANGELQHPWT